MLRLDWKQIGATLTLLKLMSGVLLGLLLLFLELSELRRCLRAIAKALNGEWFRSLSLNVLATPLGLLSGYSMASVAALKSFWILCLCLVVGFEVLRNLPVFPLG